MTKKKRNLIFVIIAAIIGLFVIKPIISNWRLQGTWNGNTWAQMQAQYPGMTVSLFGNTVTIPSRPDLGTGTLSGNTITWSSGPVWTRS